CAREDYGKYVDYFDYW
nr:immunoglobulin heavy chain junction region [Mus musculus]